MIKKNKQTFSFFFGHIFHKRTFEKIHFFKNTSIFLLIELIDLSKNKLSQEKILPLFFSYNKFNLMSWHAKDHGDRLENSTAEDLIIFVKKFNKKSFDKIFLFCLPRIFGFGFNPLSIYFCYKDNQLTQSIFEVKNTFGDIHHYVLNQINIKGHMQKARKLLFVSPFFKNKGYYHLDSKIIKNKVKVDIKYFSNKKLLLYANVNAKKIDFSSLEILKNLIKFIIFPGKIWINIHFEALRLWIKKAKLRKIPKEQTTKYSNAKKININFIK